MATQNTQSRWQVFLGFVLIALILLLAYWVIVLLWRGLSATPAVGAAIAAATLGGLATIAGHFIVKHLERKAAVVAQLREKKIPVYEDIIRLMFGIAFGGKGGRKKLNEQEMIKATTDITEKLTIWGSDEMVREFHGFRMSMLSQPSGFGTLQRVANLMLAIRKDLGHKNKDIGRREILGLFINDLPDSVK